MAAQAAALGADEVTEAVLDRLATVGLIDDEDFAAQWVRSRQMHSGKGKRALAAELRTKGVDAEVIATALGSLDAGVERVRAEQLVERRLRREALGDGDDAKVMRRLVGMASVAGIRGLPGHGAYCASKAAVISYCESLRGELRDSGVQVVTLSPGYVDTPLTRRNRYAMPFLMRPEAFADRAWRAIEDGVSYRVIPWQMGVVAKLLRLLPNPWFDRLLVGRPRKHRRTDG